MYLAPAYARHDFLWLDLMLLVACVVLVSIYLVIRNTDSYDHP